MIIKLKHYLHFFAASRVTLNKLEKKVKLKLKGKEIVTGPKKTTNTNSMKELIL